MLMGLGKIRKQNDYDRIEFLELLDKIDIFEIAPEKFQRGGSLKNFDLFRIKNTDCFIAIYKQMSERGVTKYLWMRFNNFIGTEIGMLEAIDFEELFDLLPPEPKEKIVYHLELFT